MLPTDTASVPTGTYLDWGVVHISVTNLTIILVMLLVFALALVLPFPGSDRPRAEEPRPGGDATRNRP